jgi:hypothetical protein
MGDLGGFTAKMTKYYCQIEFGKCFAGLEKFKYWREMKL